MLLWPSSETWGERMGREGVARFVWGERVGSEGVTRGDRMGREGVVGPEGALSIVRDSPDLLIS